MGGKALPIRLIKFLIIHLHSTGIPPPPRFHSIPLSLFPSRSLFLFPLCSHSLSFLFTLVATADLFNIFLNYIFNGRNKWIIDCFASVQTANRVITNALLQFSHSYKYIIQSIAEKFTGISAKMQFASYKIIRSPSLLFTDYSACNFCTAKQRKSARLDYLFILCLRKFHS